MKFHFPLIMALLFFTLPLCARLAETSADAEKRYGKPVVNSPLSDGYNCFYYLKNNYLITIVYNKQNTCVSISYQKLDSSNTFYIQNLEANQFNDIVSYRKDFTEKLDLFVIQHLLKINSDSKEWNEILRGSFWQRSDNVEAMYDNQSGILAINSPEYNQYIHKHAAESLVGF